MFIQDIDWKLGGPNGDCWEWQHYLDKDGYGIKKVGKAQRAHRLSFSAANPTVDITGKVLRHKCDNRACINPAHLEPGTMFENGVDMAVRCRQKCKLTAEQVYEIRESALSQNELSAKYGVAVSTISRIINKVRRPYI